MVGRVVLLLLLVAVCPAMDLKELAQRIDHIKTSPMVIMSMVYDSDKTGDILAFLQQTFKSRVGYFEILGIDCASLEKEAASSFAYCSGELRTHLPILTITDPPLNFEDPDTKEKREAKQVPFQGKVDEKALLNAALPLMKAYSRNLKSVDDLNVFLRDHAELPRIIHVTDKDSLSPYYKAITANFRYRIAFAHIFSNATTLVERLKVSTFPTLLLNEKESLEVKSKLKEQLDYLRQYEATEDHTIVIPESSAKEPITEAQFKELVLGTAVYSMVHLSADRPHPQWKAVQSRFQKMFEYYEAGEELAGLLGVKKLPAIVYFPKSLVKKQLHKTAFTEQQGLQDIVREVSSMIEDFSGTFSSDLEMQRLTGIALRDKKLVTVLFHSEAPSLVYRVLSNDESYKESIYFYRFKDPEPEVLKKFQIKKLPATLVMYMDETAEETEPKSNKNEKSPDGTQQMKLRIAQYTGKYAYNDMKTFFDSLVRKPQQEDTHSGAPEKEVVAVDSPKQFRRHCESESCYLLLVNGAPNNKQALQGNIRALQSASRVADSNIAWIDAVCHSEVLGALDIQQEDLPVMVYLKAKATRYSRLIGRVNEQSLKGFFAKLRAGRLSERPIDSWPLKEKNCEAEHSKLQQLENQQSTLTADEQAILDEIRRQEERKKEEAKKDADAAEKARKKQKKKKRRVVESEDSEL